MKYMTKQFGTGNLAWTEGEVLFNAIEWITVSYPVKDQTARNLMMVDVL